MNQTLIAICFYFALCAGIGYARGLKRELLVLGIAAAVLVIVVLVQNQVHAALWIHLAAGNRTPPVWAALMPEADWLTLRRQLQESPWALLVWLSACGAAYWFSQTRVPQGPQPRRWLGAMVSIGNGTLYLNLIVPLLSRNLLWPTFDLPQGQSADIAGRAIELLNTAVANRATVLTVLAIALLVYLVSRRRQANG